jgi:hypothetical protein
MFWWRSRGSASYGGASARQLYRRTSEAELDIEMQDPEQQEHFSASARSSAGGGAALEVVADRASRDNHAQLWTQPVSGGGDSQPEDELEAGVELHPSPATLPGTANTAPSPPPTKPMSKVAWSAWKALPLIASNKPAPPSAAGAPYAPEQGGSGDGVVQVYRVRQSLPSTKPSSAPAASPVLANQPVGLKPPRVPQPPPAAPPQQPAKSKTPRASRDNHQKHLAEMEEAALALAACALRPGPPSSSGMRAESFTSGTCELDDAARPTSIFLQRHSPVHPFTYPPLPP